MPSLVELWAKTLSTLPVTALVIFAAIAVIIGDYSAKAWSINQNNYYLLVSFLGYFFSAFFFIPSLLREGLIITSVMWSLMSIIGFLIIGFVIFKESLSVTQIVAVVVGIGCILVLTFAD